MTDPRPTRPGVRTSAGEPLVPAWFRQPWADLAGELMRTAGEVGPRPVVLAVDGRSGSGKSTTAARLAAAVPGAVIVHTDDVAWWESFFDWDGLLAAGVLLPARRGDAVRFRPPAWDRRGRDGAIEVPAGTPLVVVEGVGASRRSLTTLVDVSVWVQADRDEARRRGIERDGGTPEAVAFWDEWMAQEEPFLAVDRPWERATAILCGTAEQLTPEQVLGGPVGPPAPMGAAAVRALALPGWSGDLACRC